MVAIAIVVYYVRKKASPAVLATIQQIVPFAVTAVEQMADANKWSSADKLKNALDIINQAFQKEMSRPLDEDEKALAKYLVESAVNTIFNPAVVSAASATGIPPK